MNGQNAMYNRGFNYCISDVISDLNVSLSWVKHTLLKEIHYVTYSYKYLYQKLNMFSGGTVEFFEKEKIDSIHVNIRTVPYGTDEYKKYRSFIKSLYDQYKDVLVKR